MNTTTSEPEGGSSPSDVPRHTPVIAPEATTEIPVHLLFRDDFPGGPSQPIPLRPAVVSRRLGTGEQPRVGPRPPAAGSKASAAGPRPAAKARPLPPAPPRSAPPADPGIAERPGPALPGWTGVIAGACAITGIGAVLWGAGVLPAVVTRTLGFTPSPYDGLGIGLWSLIAFCVVLAVFTLGGIGRGQVGHAWVVTLFGEYRGTVRRTGLMWISPLLLRRRVDVRLRHWRSRPMPAVDADGTALRVVVLVVWRVKDTAKAVLGVKDHEVYLTEQVESAMARVLSQLPAEAPSPSGLTSAPEDAPTLRDAEAVGDALTRMLSAECAPVGIEIFSAQPTAIEYAPEVAAAMLRRRVAAIDAKHRDSVLTSVVDAVDDTVTRLTSRGLVELDDYERKALVKDLTVAFYTGRSGGTDG
ncbi:SPFH domain-containing protein [Streptomyces sp. NPDC051018]|uniref:SPFH domain-containing protein n=1 Tax=Streptomyces sp. NPDC051018 TaxID=3365639 RepID=UPI00378FDD8B